MNDLRTVVATRYVTPLREGGSLPAIVEADDDGLYVLKFRGAGQGPRALVAELLAGEIGRALGLRVPEIVLVELDPVLGRSEPDPEIQDLIKASGGVNIGLDFLPGSVTFDPLVERPDADLASRVVWFDAFVTNVDRTARNSNMLVWGKDLWLIDHGASLYFHHAGGDFRERSRRPFPMIKDHILLGQADRIADVDSELAAFLTPEVIGRVVDLVPDEWLDGDVAAAKRAYEDYFLERLAPPRLFAKEASDARAMSI